MAFNGIPSKAGSVDGVDDPWTEYRLRFVLRVSGFAAELEDQVLMPLQEEEGL